MEDDSRLEGGAPADGHFKPERMNALTDGVFAIVLTLLVLELRLPQSDESIVALLVEDRRVFIAWLISFLVIARFWLVHHAVTARLQQCHTGTLILNFAVLCAVSLVPFSADLLGTERIAEPWSTIVFAGNVGLLSLTVGLLTRHALREPHLLQPDRSRTLLSRHRSRHLYVLPTVAMVSALLAFVHPYLAVGILLAEFVVFAWGGWPAHTSQRLYSTRPQASMEGSS